MDKKKQPPFCHQQWSTSGPLNQVEEFTAKWLHFSLAALRGTTLHCLSSSPSSSSSSLTSQLFSMFLLRTRTRTGTGQPPPPLRSGEQRAPPGVLLLLLLLCVPSVKIEPLLPSLRPAGRRNYFKCSKCDEEREARHEPETGCPRCVTK